MKRNKQKKPDRLEFSTPAAACRFELVTPVVPPDVDGVPDVGETKLPTLTGYAIVWGAVSIDDRKASIAKGAVSFPPPEQPVHAMYCHDESMILGSTANGTLRLTSDDYGLRVEIDPPDTSYARDVCELVEDGYVSGMSFKIYPKTWTDKAVNGETIRTYTAIVVDEVTITAIPAFLESSIAVLDQDFREGEDQFAASTAHKLRLEGYRFAEINLN